MTTVVSFKFTMPIGGFSGEFSHGQLTLYTPIGHEQHARGIFDRCFKTTDVRIQRQESHATVTMTLTEPLTPLNLLYCLEAAYLPVMGEALTDDGQEFRLDIKSRPAEIKRFTS
jgi:hypothetical protein